jgi:hypothetical protein
MDILISQRDEARAKNDRAKDSNKFLRYITGGLLVIIIVHAVVPLVML